MPFQTNKTFLTGSTPSPSSPNLSLTPAFRSLSRHSLSTFYTPTDFARFKPFLLFTVQYVWCEDYHLFWPTGCLQLQIGHKRSSLFCRTPLNYSGLGQCIHTNHQTIVRPSLLFRSDQGRSVHGTEERKCWYFPVVISVCCAYRWRRYPRWASRGSCNNGFLDWDADNNTTKSRETTLFLSSKVMVLDQKSQSPSRPSSLPPK